jgi:hypothetical protein
MKRAFVSAAFVASVVAFSVAFAAGPEHAGEHGAEHAAPPARAVRAPAPKFAAHPQGIHPHGAIVRPHAVRVLAPRVVVRGAHAWSHWEHPEFARPAYYWDWAAIHNVSCIAEDSYGDQYPVTEAAGAGFGLDSMTGIEDDALDRCYQESGQDNSCYLATCSHF